MLYVNGAIGSQIGPGDSEVWQIDDQHPVGNGWTVPPGASPVEGCTDYECRNMARTDEIGTALADAVIATQRHAPPLPVEQVRLRQQAFYTNLHNMGFRLLLAGGDLGWQDGTLYTCEGEPSDATCTSDGGAVMDDPLLTAAHGRADPGRRCPEDPADAPEPRRRRLPVPARRLPPELVRGLPRDYDRNPEKYVPQDPANHPLGADYDPRLPAEPGARACRRSWSASAATSSATSCRSATSATRVSVTWSPARVRARRPTRPGPSTTPTPSRPSAATGWRSPRHRHRTPTAWSPCSPAPRPGDPHRVRQPEDHYEETNSGVWNLADDLWSAATVLFGRDDAARINPQFAGYTPTSPPPPVPRR